MDFTTFLSLVYCALFKYFYEAVDPATRPIDSSGNEETRNNNYDFIIVGAGTAGSVLARRLSENPNWNVLLIEAGGPETFRTDIPILAQYGIAGTRFDWNYTTVPQNYLCADYNGRCQFIRGHVMGGTAAVNRFVYARGNPNDFDEWEALGNRGWGYDDVLPYFKKSENCTIPELADSPYHSTGGPQHVGYANYYLSVFNDYYDAAVLYGFRPTDYNGQYTIGESYTQLTLDGSLRSSPARAYLNPIRNRPNLVIYQHTLVTKIIIDPNTRTAEGVRCVTNGVEYTMYASKEVILSAGAVNTPQLLMLSGIGPRQDLEQLGIDTIADLPVGKFARTHSGVELKFDTNYTELNYSEEELKEAILEYAQNKTGVLSAPRYLTLGNGLVSYSPLKSNPIATDLLILQGYGIDSIIFGTNRPILTILLIDLISAYTGYVKLNSANIYDQPLINPNYFNNGTDYKLIVRGINLVLHYLKTPQMVKYDLKLIYPPECEFTEIVTEDFARCLNTRSNEIVYSITSTARMGQPSDNTTVVSPQLNVHTLNHLRVVDASINPTLTAGLPVANTLMIAEKASDIIKCSY